MPVLRAGGAAELFGCFATVEEAGRNKSFPDIFRLAAQKLGVRVEECVVFEDNLLALRAAGSIGMRTAGVFDEASRGQQEQLRRVFTYLPLSGCRRRCVHCCAVSDGGFCLGNALICGTQYFARAPKRGFIKADGTSA